MGHQIIIESDGCNKTQVMLDGKDISEIVTDIKFSHKGGKFPVIEMGISHCEVKINSPQIPQLPEELRSFYQALD